MRNLVLTSLMVIGLFTVRVNAQVPPGPTDEIKNYFTDATQASEVARLQKLILSGCTNPLNQQPAYDPAEITYDIEQVKSLLKSKFSKSFAENPNIKIMMDKALDAIAADPSCASAGNDCRTRLVATATYFFQNLRPNIPGCEGYTPSDDKYVQKCETELILRSQVLRNYGKANGGMNQNAVYTDTLTEELNNTVNMLQDGILSKTTGQKVKKGKIVETSKSRQEISICGSVAGGESYSYPLLLNLYKDPFSGVVTNQPVKLIVPKKPPVKKVEPCTEEIKVLYEEFVPLNFAEGSATVGSNDVKPVKQKIEDFVTSHTGVVITDIEVTSSASKTPFSKVVNGKKVVDPDSDKKNLDLASRRADFAKDALVSVIANHPELKEAKYSTSGAIKGPEYVASDIALRALNSKDPSYKAKIEKLFAEYKEMLAKDAVIKSSEELLDSKRFANFYEAKYKPYQGFKIVIKGFSKATRKCEEKKDEGNTTTKDRKDNSSSNNTDNTNQ